MAKIYDFYDVHGDLYSLWFPIFWKTTRPYKNRPQMSSVRLSALLGDEKVLKMLLQLNKSVDINDPDDGGRMALIWACDGGYIVVA